jgi:hypothetical protein
MATSKIIEAARRGIVGFLLLTVLFVGAVGCGGEESAEPASTDSQTSQENPASLGDQVERDVLTHYEQNPATSAVSSVDCPDDLPEGRTSCTIEFEDGVSGDLIVTVEGAEFTWEVVVD